jgi:hypothetical protein
MQTLTLTQNNNSLQLCIFETNEDFLLIFGVSMYQGQTCVAQKNHVDATFDLDPVTLKPKFLSALYLLNE